MQIIVVEARDADFKASLKNESSIWGCGETRDAAIGELIRSHPNMFQIKLEYVGDAVRRHR